jgi:hypothetical protein
VDEENGFQDRKLRCELSGFLWLHSSHGCCKVKFAIVYLLSYRTGYSSFTKGRGYSCLYIVQCRLTSIIQFFSEIQALHSLLSKTSKIKNRNENFKKTLKVAFKKTFLGTFRRNPLKTSC